MKPIIADTASARNVAKRETERAEALVQAVTRFEAGDCVCETCAKWGFEYLAAKCRAGHGKGMR